MVGAFIAGLKVGLFFLGVFLPVAAVRKLGGFGGYRYDARFSCGSILRVLWDRGRDGYLRYRK